MFIGVIIGGVMLFLLAAMVLPEASHNGAEVNLARHYERARTRFWLMSAAHWVVMTAVSTWAQIAIGGARYSWVSQSFT